MTKQRRKKSDNVTIRAPGFWGVPLFFGRVGRELRPDSLREAGEHIVNFVNGSEGQRFLTTDGWSDSTDGDRQMLLRWLSKLPKLPPKMLKEIADYAKQVEPQATEVTSRVKNGKIEIRALTECLIPTSKIGYAYIIASLVSAGHGENFAKCPECGTWFFDVPSGRPMKKFCSQVHANRHRQRKYREKQK